MKRKSFLKVLTVVLTVIFASAVYAAEPYQETICPLANRFQQDTYKMVAFDAHANGAVDYVIQPIFSVRDPEKRELPQWFRSSDGGKTWNKKDMNWYREVLRKHIKKTADGYDLGFGSVHDFYITESGDAYFLADTGCVEYVKGDAHTNYETYELFKYGNGILEKLPGLTLGSKSVSFLAIADVGEHGEVAIFEANSADANDIRDAILFYHPGTGKLTKTELPVDTAKNRYWSAFYAAYANGVAYCNVVDGINTVAIGALDAHTGKALFTIPLPNAQKNDFSICRISCAEDGTVYVPSSYGLYKLDPGTKQFTLVAERSASLFGNENALPSQSSYAAGGKVYVPMWWNENGKSQMILTSYAPKR